MDKSSGFRHIYTSSSKFLPNETLGTSSSDNFDLKFVTSEEMSNVGGKFFFNVSTNNNRVHQNIKYDSYLIKAIEEEMEVSSYERFFKNDTTGLFECFKCDFSITSFCHLKPHLYRHMLVKPFACLYCNFETIYNRSFKSHKKLHLEYDQPLTKFDINFNYSLDKNDSDMIESKSINILSSNDTYKKVQAQDTLNCSSCSFKSEIPASLELHAKTHLGKKDVIRCLDCSFQTSTNIGLKIHKKKKHSKLLTYNQHSNMVKEDGNELQSFSCSFCPFKGITLKGLKIHSSVHSHGRFEKFTEFSKVFKCNICPYESLSSLSIRNHKFNKHGQKKRKKI